MNLDLTDTQREQFTELRQQLAHEGMALERQLQELGARINARAAQVQLLDELLAAPPSAPA